ncbi:MAG: hypothetical protein JO372_12660 [Solirubrobacterales bacterium]|nr:hypothetical protein [Solirubrobacterales bacterium]
MTGAIRHATRTAGPVLAIALVMLVASGSAFGAPRPTVKLSPAATGPIRATIKVSVTGCAPGIIRITDTINGGSQTIRGNGAPAAIVSKGAPGRYTVTAKCSDGAIGRALFVVNSHRPSVKLSPVSSGPVIKTVTVSVTGCPPGSIRITDTINGGSQRIRGNGASATVVSDGTPGTYSVTAKCSDGETARAKFVVHRGNGPIVTLSPSTTGPVTTTVNITVTGCPKGPIRITDTINNGSQTIRGNGAPATVVSQGNPGNYTVTAKCANGETAHAVFVVTPGGVVQTGGGSTSSRGSSELTTLGLALLALGATGGVGLWVGLLARRR